MKKGAKNLSVPSDWLRKIIAGECTIQKELWRPGQYGIYWFYSPIERKVLSMLYSDYSIIGYVMLKIGNCYRTKEGAEKDASKWKEFFDSDELDKLKEKWVTN